MILKLWQIIKIFMDVKIEDGRLKFVGTSWQGGSRGNKLHVGDSVNSKLRFF
jgi:hypothetical protein